MHCRTWWRQGYATADGSLDGFEFGYLPEFVTGEPFDAVWESSVEGVGPDANRTWIPEDGLWRETSPEEADGPSVLWGEAMRVYVTRSDHFTDLDAYFEAHENAEPADHLGEGEIREFASGEGLYTGTYAVWIPEPGVAVVVNLSDPALEEDPEDEDEAPAPAGGPEEMLRVLEGITRQ
ncbi:hypothetical protein BJF83_24650 [Nocardiopsis sp. CNR-923]|uniref:hypothetical protein n=1 Tax=Nocardiopsis sp. CNR-923 TaxID=1904965 RepID=UPI0009670E1F|nr:hypothetical protein [Nocardiopsis sp. CNR-923]OLT30690.1 hypothetical protein BJF83_24650 [Nocardiopsis sp. CNR-923]